MSSAEAKSRATWVWESERIISSEVEHQRLLNHCESLGIDRVFVQLPRAQGAHHVGTDFLPMAKLVERLRGSGVEVHGLVGAPDMALSRNHRGVLYTVEAVRSYNSLVPQTARFDGFHLDVEPHVLPQWRERGVATQFFGLLKKVRFALAGADLEFGADVPFWFDEIPGATGDSLFDDVLDAVDVPTVLAYRTEMHGEDGALGHVVAEIAAAKRQGRKIYVALDVSPGVRKISFHSLGRRAAMAGLRTLEKSLADHDTVAGVAIHSYDALSAL